MVAMDTSGGKYKNTALLLWGFHAVHSNAKS